MHVALISPAWPLDKYPNGIVTYVHWMREALRGAGHQVSVFCVALEQAEEGVYRVKPGLLFRFQSWLSTTLRTDPFFWVLRWGRVYASAIRAVHAREPIDVVEMEESFGWFDDVARETDIPVVVKLHGPAFMSLVDEELESPFGVARIRKEGSALARHAVLTSPARYTLEQTVAHYGLKPAVRQHIVNPLALPPSASVWDLSSCDRKTILFVGRFDKRKGGDLALIAFAKLLGRYPDLTLTFVGPDAGIPGDNGALEHFDQVCARLFSIDQMARIHFKGKLQPEQIYALRTQALLTVVASRWENQSYTALEAMLQGCPLVSSDAGGQAEIVAHGVTGLLARAGSADDLHDKIESLLLDHELAASLGRAARLYALDQHGPARVMRETMAVYDDAIARSASKRAMPDPQAA